MREPDIYHIVHGLQREGILWSPLRAEPLPLSPYKEVKKQQRLFEDLLMFKENSDGSPVTHADAMNQLEATKLLLEDLFKKKGVGETIFEVQK